MIVEELIAELQKQDPKAVVFVEGDGWETEPAAASCVVAGNGHQFANGEVESWLGDVTGGPFIHRVVPR